MRALVVYESMFGNTHEVAEQIGHGLEGHYDVTVLPVTEALAGADTDVDLLVVGGPTHVHGMTSAASRKSAAEQADGDADLGLDEDANVEGPGLREWLGELPKVDHRSAAAFDTRIDAPAMLTGRASKAIAKRLGKHGFRLVVEPESFLVDKESHLVPGERERARSWAELIG